MLSRGRDVPYLRFRPAQDAPEESAQLERDGWTLLRAVLSRAEVDAPAAEVTRVYDAWPADVRRPHRAAEELEQFRYEVLNRSAACQAVVGHHRILAVVEPLLGEDCHVIANTAWRNPPAVEHTHGGGLWHIDAGPHIPLPPGVDWDERIPHPVFAVGCHILLQDCPVACGPTAVIPRSHLSGEPPPPDRLADPTLSWRGNEPVVLAAAAGDVQLFVSDVWHRRMPTGAGDAGRFFLQVHYGRRDIAPRLRPTAVANQLSEEAIGRTATDRDRTLVGLHRPLFYDG
ncbi:MAG: phytanoyl-CoA dioxygenase family protein [Acidimicrobiales bacterium]|nr:phytanoyl-CoA dioxygenase family protein [Acidimicrobiales bacterium]